MPRTFAMNWQGAPYYRWRRMFKGTQYYVSCDELGAKDRTQEASWQLANQWWEKKYLEVAGPTKEQIDTLANERNWEVAWELLGDKSDPLKKELFRQAYAPQPVPADQRVDTATKDFLAILARTQKPHTFAEIKAFLGTVEKWYGGMSVKNIDEKTVADAFSQLSSLAMGEPAKKKRWAFFKRFVSYLAEMKLIELPRNLHSKLFKFSTPAKEVKKWPIAEVRVALASLPDRFQLYALLGLNCGMTNCDIAELRKDMVKDGHLTRRRTKTKQHGNVPTVSYKLWPETVVLLNQFKSEDSTLWLVSETGTKLVENRIENGEVKTKDLIYLNWKRQVGKECPIPLCKFRSIGSALLEDNEQYGRYTELFLGHSPKSIKDRHYTPPSQKVFDKAMEWMRQQVYGKGV